MDELNHLRQFRADVPECDDLAEARARLALRKQLDGGHQGHGNRRRRTRVAVLGVLVGIGAGFGFATWLTPSGSATSNVLGFGFLPAEGWSVAQSGTLAETGTANAVAANLPLGPVAEPSGLPLQTLRNLPATGAVIAVRLSPRGDERQDSRFELRKLPLRVASAVPATALPTRAEPSLVALQIRGAADGYNLHVRMFFGGPPSPSTLGRVDEQLRRLVVAPGSVSLVVQPRIIRRLGQPMSIFGSVSSARAGEKVTIQFNGCGLSPSQFRDSFETTTNPGGGFSVEFPPPLSPGTSGVYRAIHGDSVSAGVTIRHQAPVTLRILRRGRFEAAVTALSPFWRRYVVLQRYERRRGTWVNLRRLILTEQGYSGSSGTVPFQTAPFRPSVPRGTRIRVVVPLSQARPCYVAGVSEVRRA